MKSSFFVIYCISFIVLCSAIEKSERDEAAKRVDELFSAIDHGDVNAVQSLIDKGVQLNYEYLGEDGKPYQYPLQHAIGRYPYENFNEEIFKLLIKNGANLEAVNIYGFTPLFTAIDYNNAKAVKILLENGANPNTYYENKGIRYKMSALGEAFSQNVLSQSGEEIIDLLIEYGADVNEIDAHGETPLQNAISGGYKKAIEMLIEKGANVNVAEKKRKMTPLHYIALYDSSFRGYEHWTDADYLKFAQLLIDHGADVYAKAYFDDGDWTPLDMASLPKVKILLGSKMGFMGWLRTFWL